MTAPPVKTTKSESRAAATGGIKGTKQRGTQQTPEVLGFASVRVVPGYRDKARMVKRWLPGREPK